VTWSSLSGAHGSIPESATPAQVRNAFEAHLLRSLREGGGRTILFLASMGPQRDPCRVADVCLVPSNALDVANALCQAFDALGKCGGFDVEARRVLLNGVAEALRFEIADVREKEGS